jgi:hypothetical protein
MEIIVQKRYNDISVLFGGKMKKFLAILAGVLLLLALTGCGPKGGTITLVNGSSYQLTNAKISMGDSNVPTLNPGQWMKASYDKNQGGFSIAFTVALNVLSGEKGEDKVSVTGVSGSWGLLGRFTSGLISVENGESVIVTVQNAPPKQP